MHTPSLIATLAWLTILLAIAVFGPVLLMQ